MADQNPTTLENAAELRSRLLAGEHIGHCQIDGWRLWPSLQRVSDEAVKALRENQREQS